MFSLKRLIHASALPTTNGSRDLNTPLSGQIFHLRACTFYYQPIYQTWSL